MNSDLFIQRIALSCPAFEQQKSEHHATGLGNVDQENSEMHAMSSERRQAENEDRLQVYTNSI